MTNVIDFNQEKDKKEKEEISETNKASQEFLDERESAMDLALKIVKLSEAECNSPVVYMRAIAALFGTALKHSHEPSASYAKLLLKDLYDRHVK